MFIAAVAAALTAVPAVLALPGAEGGTELLEAWRAYGLVVFAGLFVLLGRHPLAQRGLWELVIFHKVALTFTAMAFAVHSVAADACTVLVADGALSVLLVTAYVLCRGWRAGKV
jgi:hypothetical protein